MTILEFEGRIAEKRLRALIADFKVKRETFREEEEYYFGNNLQIGYRTKDAESQASGAPDWKLQFAYGRKLVKTVSGYLYKPGNTTYTWGAGADRAEEIFKDNIEPSKTNVIRTYSLVNGVSFELHYLEPLNDGTDGVKPRFALIKAADGLPIYSTDIEPKLKAFIRLLKTGDDYIYEVYYDTEIVTYKFNKTNSLVVVEEADNFYGVVPIVVNSNNHEEVSEIKVVKRLIDAYDVLGSDSMNEFDRFAWAYLVMSGTLDEEDVKKIKERRIFEGIENDDALKFLTKDIPADFIRFMSEWLKTEIHAQSFIPNIEDLKFAGAASGIAIDKFIYLMEYNVADKEAFTKIALTQRVDMLNRIPKTEPIELEEIKIERNLPAMEAENAKLFEVYAGRISKETNMKQHANFIKDPKKEIELMKEENPLPPTAFEIEDSDEL